MSSGTNQEQNFPDGMLTPFSKMTQLEKIDSGAFGDVYKAEHADWGTVAFKKLPVSFIRSNDRAVRGMMREVEILKKLRHQNIVTITGVVFENGSYGIVLEFMFHGNVDNFFVTFRVPMPWKVQLVYDVVLGMNYLHMLNTPIIHGDLKIQNILVTEGYQAKISDFGLSSWNGMAKSSSRKADIAGTVTHIAPERWSDVNESRNEKEDIYAFGVLVWEMFTEEKPFPNLSNAIAIMLAVSGGQRPDVNRLNDDTPSVIRPLIETSWTTNPDDRKPFKDIKADLGSYISSHAGEIKAAKHNLQRQESSSDLSLETDGSLGSVATNENLPIQRRDTNGLTENAQLSNHQQTTQATSEIHVHGSSSNVHEPHPVSALDHTEPSQAGRIPDDPRQTSTSSQLAPSLCLDNSYRQTALNIPADSPFQNLHPIQESDGKASPTQTAIHLELNVTKGQGLISLESYSSSLASRPGGSDGSETFIKGVVSDQTASLPMLTCVEGNRINDQSEISIRSDHPSRVGDQVYFDLHSQRNSSQHQDFDTSTRQPLDFGKENLRTVLNRPFSVPEADATLTPSESESQDKTQLSFGCSNSLPSYHDDQSNCSKDPWEKSNELLKIDLMNWNKNTEYNNLDTNKGFYPKDGGSFREHTTHPVSSCENINCPPGQSRDETPPRGYFPPHPPRQNSANSDGNGRPKSPNSFHRGDNCGSNNNGSSSMKANSSAINWQKDGKEVTIFNTSGVGPYVQFGDNNTMHITTSSPGAAARQSPSPSSSRDQPGRSARSKGPTKIEKIIVPDRLVDRDIILIVADGIGRDWTRLARELGVRDSDIGSYEADHHHMGVKEIAYQMLRDWVERKGAAAKLQLLAKALVAIKRPDVALKLSSGALAARPQ